MFKLYAAGNERGVKMRESGIGPWINFGREVGKLFRLMEICHFFFFGYGR